MAEATATAMATIKIITLRLYFNWPENQSVLPHW